MNLKRLTAQMEHNAQAVKALVRELSEDQACWQPRSDSWSILDVINHLAYEEVDDFRGRLDLVLHRPEDAWPAGDAARGVTKTGRRRGLDSALEGFLVAREASLAWLEDLESPNWDATLKAPFGEIRAGDFMAAWAAHDLLHLRQLIELRWALLSRDVEPYRARYAGDW